MDKICLFLLPSCS